MLTTKPAFPYLSKHHIIRLGIRKSLINYLIPWQQCITKHRYTTLCLMTVNNLTWFWYFAVNYATALTVCSVFASWWWHGGRERSLNWKTKFIYTSRTSVMSVTHYGLVREGCVRKHTHTRLHPYGRECFVRNTASIFLHSELIKTIKTLTTGNMFFSLWSTCIKCIFNRL